MSRPLIHGILEKMIMMDVNLTKNDIGVHLIIMGHKDLKTYLKETVVEDFLVSYESGP
jgi:hypothetical protein